MKKQKLVLSKETIRPLDARALGNVAGGTVNGQACIATTTQSDVSQPARCGIDTVGCTILVTISISIRPY